MSTTSNSTSKTPIPMLYVTNFCNSNLQPISTVTALELGTNNPPTEITVGLGPEGIIAIPQMQLLYVTNGNDNTVSVVSAATNSVIMTIGGVGPSPFSMVAKPDGSKVYVANYQSLPSGTISVIATDTNTVVDTFTVPSLQGVAELAISPDGSTLYANSENNDVVAVLSTADGSTIATIPIGNRTGGMAVSADGSRLYTSVLGSTTSSEGPGQTVAVASTATNTVTGTITLQGEFPGYLVFGPGGDYLYVVTESTTVSVVDVSQQATVASIVIGSPLGIVIGPDGHNVYVSNSDAAGNTSVSVVALSSNSVTGTLPGGTGAGQLAALKVNPTSAYSRLVSSALNGTFRASPDPTHNYNFSACAFKLKNLNPKTFPGPNASPWVSVDFYVSTSNTRAASTMTLIGDVPLYVNDLASEASMDVNVATQTDGLYNMSRFLLGNPNLLTVGTTYYLYVQVRNPDGSIDFDAGSFAPSSFVYST